MCGIAGIFNYATRQPVDTDILSRMTARLAHRGPDDSGIFTDGHVGLGHRRLSIIDTSQAGHQPMPNDDGSIIIAYNGECYNYRDHIPLLKSKGYVLRSNTDTEVVLRLYEEYGTKCIEMLNGMFAFAIWDARKQQFFLCRDRLGIKPLYVFNDGKRLLFSSELKSFLGDPTFPKALNPEALRNYLRFMCVPDFTAIFDGVTKLLPGHSMTVNEAGATIHEYWNLASFEQRKGVSLDAAAQEFDELFETIVREQMVSDVPLGTFLSGGVDSSAITAKASMEAKEALKTFSVAFTGLDDYDESKYATQVSRRYATDHNVLEIKPNLIDTLGSMAWHADEPFAISSAFALYHLAEMASKQVKVVLSGDGADEIFAGYEHRYVPLPRRLPASFAPLATLLPGRLSKSLKWRTTPSSKDFSDRINRYHPDQINGLLNPEILYQLHDQQDIVAYYFDKPATASKLSRMLYADMKTSLPAEMLTKADRMTMAFGLEVRVPFLDHRLVEFAFTLPDTLRINREIGKRVVKKAMEPLLPNDLLYRPKHGFNVPMGVWLRGELKDWAMEMLSPDALARRNIFNSDFVQTLVADHMNGEIDNSNRLFMLIMFELWSRQFLDS